MASKSQKIDGRLKEGSDVWKARFGSRTRAEVDAELEDDAQFEKDKDTRKLSKLQIISRTGASQPIPIPSGETQSGTKDKAHLSSVREEVANKNNKRKKSITSEVEELVVTYTNRLNSAKKNGSKVIQRITSPPHPSPPNLFIFLF